jgi:phosphoribosylanthranilate isomerase
MKNIIQIAGVRNQNELEILVSCGVDYIGFPFRLTHHPEDISESEAARMIRQLPNKCKAVLITYLNKAIEIIELCNKLGVNSVQLHGEIQLEELQNLNASNPDINIFKSIIIGRSSWGEIEKLIDMFAPWITAFITDTFDPSSGASGATGKTHDWKISRKIVHSSPKPVILAGGLHPNNIKEAVHIVRPVGVDVHTGVENTRGFKEREKVQQFVTRARQAFEKIQ